MQKTPHRNFHRITILQSAYDSMMHFAKKNIRKEVLGIFFGQVHVSNQLNIVDNYNAVIEEAFPFRVGKRKEVQFEDQDYEKAWPLIQDCAKRNMIWLGWFHSHPFRGGDHLYMSQLDKEHHFPAQNLNPHWTALIINPYQIHDTSTTKGIRAFQFAIDNQTKKMTDQLTQISLTIRK